MDSSNDIEIAPRSKTMNIPRSEETKMHIELATIQDISDTDEDERDVQQTKYIRQQTLSVE